MHPLDLNKLKFEPGWEPRDGSRILQKADAAWSKLKLEHGEVLLVKVAKHMIPQMQEIKGIIDSVFKREGDKVLIFAEGDVEFAKVDMRESPFH